MKPYKIAYIQLNSDRYKPYIEIDGFISNDLQYLVMLDFFEVKNRRHTFPLLLDIAKKYGVIIFEDERNWINRNYNFYALIPIENVVFQKYIEDNYMTLLEILFKADKTTHNFNLNYNQKAEIENMVKWIRQGKGLYRNKKEFLFRFDNKIESASMSNKEHCKRILEFIYRDNLFQKRLNCLIEMLYDDKLDIPNYTFFRTFQDDKKIQKLFTKQ